LLLISWWTRCFKNERADSAANWLKWSTGQSDETVNSWSQEVKGQGHTTTKLDFQAGGGGVISSLGHSRRVRSLGGTKIHRIYWLDLTGCSRQLQHIQYTTWNHHRPPIIWAIPQHRPPLAIAPKPLFAPHYFSMAPLRNTVNSMTSEDVDW